MKHQATQMVFIDRTPKKSKRTAHFRNGFNVWLNVYKCPVCNARRAPLANLDRERKPRFCTGTERSNYYKDDAVVPRHAAGSGGEGER